MNKAIRAVGHWAGWAALVCLVFATPNETYAQNKVHRVGWLLSTPSTFVPTQQAVEAFRQALRELGYTEGANLNITIRFAEKGTVNLFSA